MRALGLAVVVTFAAAAAACGGTTSGTGNGDGSGAGGGSGSGSGSGTGSGSGGGTGSGSGSGNTGSGGNGGSSFELDFSRPSTSTTYDACELSTYRVVTFERAPGSFTDGFSCDATGGTPTSIQATLNLDFTTTGVTPCGTVKAPSSGKVAEVWVLAKAKVKKRGQFHAAHGQLTCTGSDGHRYVVLRFVPGSTVDLSAAATVRLVAVFDVQRTVVEHGECAEGCDEDDEQSEAEAESDSKHGSISLQSQCSLAKGD